MLWARYAASDGVELAGSTEGLRLLAARLGKDLVGVERLAERPPEPYDRSLVRIDVRNGGRALRISIEDETLVIAGDGEALCGLSATVSRFVDDHEAGDDGDHFHVEWYPGNDFVAEDSEPLVVAYEDA